MLHGICHTEQKETNESDIKYARAGSIYFRDRPLENCWCVNGTVHKALKRLPSRSVVWICFIRRDSLCGQKTLYGTTYGHEILRQVGKGGRTSPKQLRE